MVRIEPVSAIEFVPHASRVLEEAWPPTALSYSPGYLAWQFGFPGAGSLPAAAAWDGAEPVGVAGATMRRVYCGGVATDVAIVTFVAVRPGWQRRGIADRLYDCLLGELKWAGVVVMTFGMEGSAGERKLLAAYERSGFEVRQIGAYCTYGFSRRPGQRVETGCSVEVVPPGEVVGVEVSTMSERDARTMWNALEGEQLAHYRSDPRPRKLLRVRGSGGAVLGAAWVVRSAVRTPRGLEQVPTVDSVLMPSPEAGAVRAVCEFAATCWAPEAGLERGAGAWVMAANLWGLGPEAVAAAGLRRTPTTWRGYLCWQGRAGEALSTAAGTNVEIV